MKKFTKLNFFKTKNSCFIKDRIQEKKTFKSQNSIIHVFLELKSIIPTKNVIFVIEMINRNRLIFSAIARNFIQTVIKNF